MLKIGLTGGMGSGKTTVAAIFELMGVPVYYADLQARKLMEEDPALRASIEAHFGAGCYANGKLNRPHLASLVFHNPEKLMLLNSLVHPITLADAASWMKNQELSGFPYAIKEAALIFESESHQQLDHVIGVSSPLRLRVQRVKERDGLAEDQIHERIRSQMDEEEKMMRCDWVLINDEQQLLIPQVIHLHEKLTLTKADI
jgi:dephospho-CoA kinase